ARLRPPDGALGGLGYAGREPVETAPLPGCWSSFAMMSLGPPKPPWLPSREANTVVVTRPASSIVGLPELPWRTIPRRLVIVRATGPWPYASWLITAVVEPRRPGT